MDSNPWEQIHLTGITKEVTIKDNYETFLIDRLQSGHQTWVVLVECLSSLTSDHSKGISSGLMKVPKDCHKLLLNPKFQCERCSKLFKRKSMLFPAR